MAAQINTDVMNHEPTRTEEAVEKKVSDGADIRPLRFVVFILWVTFRA
jgi:hypothetical protein